MAGKWPTLKNAPVQEAILELKFLLPQNTAYDGINSFCDNLKDRFPKKREKISFSISGKVDDTEGKGLHTIDSKRKKQGFILTSEDGKSVIMISLSSLSYHFITPYRSWPKLVEEAKEIWEIFLNYFDPSVMIMKLI